MKKKIFAVALSTVMACTMAVAFTACGDDNDDKDTTYTVTYAKGEIDADVTLPTDTTRYKEGDTVTVKGDDYVISGYEFVGWSYGTNTYQKDDTFKMPASNVTLTAIWKSEYTVFYQYEDRAERIPLTTLITKDYKPGQTVELGKPDELKVAEGKVFVGWWYLDEKGVEIHCTANDTLEMPARDLYLHAIVEDAPAEKITVHFDVFGDFTLVVDLAFDVESGSFTIPSMDEILLAVTPEQAEAFEAQYGITYQAKYAEYTNTSKYTGFSWYYTYTDSHYEEVEVKVEGTTYTFLDFNLENRSVDLFAVWTPVEE